MEALIEWRADLRRFLAERVDQQLSAGDLFDRFGANMPLHHATRLWLIRGGTLGTTPHDQMRWNAFSQTLRQLNVRFESRLSPQAPLRKETKVIAQTTACAGCGRAFFSYLTSRYCGRDCGKRRGAKPIQARSMAGPLADLAARIRAEHTAAGEGLNHAIAAGELLIEAKGKTPHGQWRAWLEANCQMSERTAQAYMRVARSYHNLGSAKAQRVADSSFRGALKLLSEAHVGEADTAPVGKPEQTVTPLSRPGPRGHRYTLNLTESEFQAAKEKAEQRNQPISEVVREALLAWLSLGIRQAAE